MAIDGYFDDKRTMIKIGSCLLCCLLAGSQCDAFAVVRHNEPAQFGVHRSRTLSSTSRIPALITLSMVDGASTAPPPPLPELKPPLAMYEGSVAAGAMKASAPFWKIFKLGIVAGCHIAFGAYLSISVGGACPGLAETNPGLQKIVMVRVVLLLRTFVQIVHAVQVLLLVFRNMSSHSDDYMYNV